MIPSLSPFLEEISDKYDNSLVSNHSEKLKNSDIAGNDLYAEKISTYIAGDNALHKHSIFTNDTNILNRFDTSDPAFYKCNVFISASNGIQSDIFPLSLTTRNIENQFRTSFNSFAGFLYYDKDLGANNLGERAQRALEIIKRKFGLDIIPVNSSDPSFFPFIGYYPQWNSILEELTNNIPQDGYWNALDLERLINYDYYSEKHLSISYALINSPDFFLDKVNMGNDQVDFNTGASVSSFLEAEGFIQDIMDQITDILEENEELFDNVSTSLGINESISSESMDEIANTLGDFSFRNDSHYTIIEVQYEGLEKGFTRLSDNEYKFDLFDSLGFDEEYLEPSENIYNDLMGAFLSELETFILCSEIAKTTPSYSKFNSELLDQLGLILYLANIDFDVQTLENYSFELLWRDQGGLKCNFVNPLNLKDDYDIINFLPLLGFTGIDSYPAGILEPLNNYEIEYKIIGREPSINVKTKLNGENATYGAYRDFNFDIIAENVGIETAWGVATKIPITLDDVFPILVFLEGGNPFYADEFKDSIWQIVNDQYPEYDSLEEFFNFNEDPKIFSFDTFGDGATDYYFPNFLNMTNLYPYNEKMDEIVNMLYLEYPTLIINLGLTVNEIKEAFNNPNSVWNEENWKLKPGEKIIYQSENYSISDMDSFSKFHSINFTIDSEENLPNVKVGERFGSTQPEMARVNDNESWTILSQQEDFEEQIEIQFLAKNNSIIDLINNSIDRISLEINLTDSSGGTQFEIFNFELEEYEDLQTYLRSSENSTRIFSITKYNDSINWIFQNPQEKDYSIIFRIRSQNDEDFNISINSIDISLEDRDINFYKINSSVNHASQNGNLRYYSHSNSITLSTENMASLVAFSNISEYSSLPGDVINYTLVIQNIGSEKASNLTVELPIPGIIQDKYNFSIKENSLILELDTLSPREEKLVKISFQAPNSGLLDKTIIRYNNNVTSGNTRIRELSSNPNDIFYSVPIDYYNYTPHLNIIDVSLNTSINNPRIFDLFNITLSVKNVGLENTTIKQISIYSNDEYGDLKRVGNEFLNLTNIEYNKTASQNFILNKTDWKGYFYPAINFISNENSKVIEILNSNPLIIGYINLSLKKEVDKNQVNVDDTIIVNVELRNTGTICIKDLNINDMLGVPPDIFDLVEGKLIHEIKFLGPNQTFAFNYIIRAKSQRLSVFQGASVEYYYLIQQRVVSNEIIIKVSESKILQYLYIFIPSSIGIAMIIGYIIYLRTSQQKKREIERAEMRTLHLTSRDSILNIELNLEEFLSKEKDKGYLNQRGMK